MYNIYDLLDKTAEYDASDMHLTVGVPPMMRLQGDIKPLGKKKISPDDSEKLLRPILDDEKWKVLNEAGEVDFSISVRGHFRCRVNVYHQRGCMAAAFRIVKSDILDFQTLGLPSVIKTLCLKQRGLVLITGPTGSGKTTTLASMIDMINKTRSCNIITLEDPIEYLHNHQKSTVNQREIGADTTTFQLGLRAALRQDPDVILIGEMRDKETISIALTAAETGHLVLSTLHTIGAAKTIDRIIDVFPPSQQQQIKVQLSASLQGVVSQQLLQKKDGTGRVPAVEIMVAVPAVRNLIREGKSNQMDNIMMTSAQKGMILMDKSISELVKKGVVSNEEAYYHAVDFKQLQDYIES